MAKLWTYVTISTGIIFLLTIAGIPTGLNWILSYVGYNTTNGLNTSDLYTAIIVLLGLPTLGSVVMSLFGRSAPEYAFLATFAIESLIVFAGTFVALANYMSNFGAWLYYPILGIMLVYGIGFLLATVAFVFGGDQ